jgi:hypothetical protein
VGNKMSHGGSGVLAPYNADQKTIIKAFDNANGMEKDASYLFFVSEVIDKDANIAGYMPLSYNVGFIYGLPSNNTIAHELGHGAFNLYHTFADKNNIAPEGATQNLMDYAGGTELWHYQWDLIHDPESMALAFLQDESEAEMVNEDTELTITYKKLNDDFEPGKKDLSVEYSIAKLEDIAKEHKDVTKAFIWIIINGETVYTADLPLKNVNSFKWNGKSNSGETEVEIEGLSEFTIKIGVTIEYNYSIENLIEWLFTEDVDFKLASEKENNWAVLKWKKDFENFEHKESMQYVTEERYLARKEQYITRLEAFGVNTAEISPLEYLNEHLVGGDFLGQEIPSINIRFLYFLRKLEEKLGRGKNWSQNSVAFNNYCALAPFIQDYARMSSVGSSISDHGTGFAFDFDKDKNPWLDSDNKYQDKLIQIVTSKKILSNTYSVFSGNGADEIKQASDDFLERIEGNNFDISDIEELKTVYKNIADYSEKISLINIDKSTEFNNLISGARSTIEGFVVNDPNILQSELEAQKQNLLNDIETTSNFFELYEKGLDELKLLFDASKSGLFINYNMGNNYAQLYSFITDYKTNSNSIITYLEGVSDLSTTSGTAWNDGINTLKNNLSTISFSSGYQSHLTQFVTKFNEKKNILGTEIEEFPQKLKDETDGRNSYMGGTLFENGFCSLDKSLIKAIIQTKITLNNLEMRLMWGGSYYSTKDIMHFELRKEAGNPDRPYQKAVHGVEMQDIKDYLNSFKNRNGDDYDY